MNHFVRLTIALTTALAGLGGTDVAPAGAEGSALSRTGTVTLSGPRDVVEGDRYKITAKVTSARRARTISWQGLLPEYSGDSTPVWTTIRTKRVDGSRTQTMRAVADSSPTQRYRAVVTYADGGRVTSRRIGVRVWHWTDLTDFSAYYEVGSAYTFLSFAMNGDIWKGWYDYNSPMAESRYTLGRHCKAFRGTLGVGDSTHDGGAAQITLLTDETNVIYTSPMLVPGQVTAVQLDLDMPYRFSIQGRNTSPDDGTVRDVYPAIGAPQFLCHVG